MAQKKYIQSDNADNQAPKKSVRAFILFMMLISNPKDGWKRIKNAKFNPEEYARTLFYPLLALMSVCRFVELAYGVNAGVATLLQQAVAGFVAGFAGYFLVLVLGRWFLPDAAKARIESVFGKIYVMTNLSVLAFGATLYELLPTLGLLLFILPIYISYIVVKGIRFLRVPENEETAASVIMVLLTLGVPMAIYFTLEFMMPASA